MMRDDELDNILANDEEILPSSGFSESVMAAIRREHEALPAIPFPWKRAIPGFAALTVGLAALVIGIVMYAMGAGADAEVSGIAVWKDAAQSALSGQMGWIVLAAILSLASVKLSARIASGRR